MSTSTVQTSPSIKEEDEDVFEEEEEHEKLWSSPLMDHKSPFDDYKDLFADIPKTTRSKAKVFKYPSPSKYRDRFPLCPPIPPLHSFFPSFSSSSF